MNELLVVECKSYLNSSGVGYESLAGISKDGAKRYKLFTLISLISFSRGVFAVGQQSLFALYSVQQDGPGGSSCVLLVR